MNVNEINTFTNSITWIIITISGIAIIIIILVICAVIETARNTKRANELIFAIKKELETTNTYLYTIAENQVEIAKLLNKKE